MNFDFKNVYVNYFFMLLIFLKTISLILITDLFYSKNTNNLNTKLLLHFFNNLYSLGIFVLLVYFISQSKWMLSFCCFIKLAGDILLNYHLFYNIVYNKNVLNENEKNKNYNDLMVYNIISIISCMPLLFYLVYNVETKLVDNSYTLKFKLNNKITDTNIILPTETPTETPTEPITNTNENKKY